MSDDSSHKVDWLRTLAGALAAVATAVLLSTLGAAGTLIGAALGSVVMSVGTSMFSSGLARGRRRVADVQEAALRHVGVAQAEIRRAGRRTGESEAHLDHADDVLAQAKEELSEAPPTLGERLGEVAWGRVALYAGGLFVVVMLVITGFELITGKPVSSLTGGSNGGGTSISRVGSNQHPKKSHPTTPAPGTTPSATPSASEAATPSATPSPSPSEAPSETTAPTESPAPSELPTDVPPSTDAIP